MKACIGIDYEFNSVVVAKSMDKHNTDIDLIVRESLPFMDTVRRIDYVPDEKTLAVSGLSGQDVIIKPIKFPGKTKARDITDGVKNIFQDTKPRYVQVGRGDDSTLVIAASAPDAAVNRLTGQISRFGLECPCAVDLRVLALWRGAKYFDPSPSARIIIEETPGGARIVAGRETLEFAREINGDNLEFGLRQSIASYKSDFTDRAEIFIVGEQLPADLAAVGMSLFPFMEPKLDFASANKKGIRWNKKLILAGAMVWLLIISAPWAMAHYWDSQSQAVQKNLTTLTPSLVQANKLAQKTKDIQSWTSILKSFRPTEVSLEINDIRYALPQNAWLTGIESTGSKAQSTLPSAITGFDLTGYADSMDSIAAFRDNLSVIPWVQNSQLVSSSWDKEIQSYKFDILIQGGGTIE